MASFRGVIVILPFCALINRDFRIEWQIVGHLVFLMPFDFLRFENRLLLLFISEKSQIIVSFASDDNSSNKQYFKYETHGCGLRVHRVQSSPVGSVCRKSNVRILCSRRSREEAECALPLFTPKTCCRESKRIRIYLKTYREI